MSMRSDGTGSSGMSAQVRSLVRSLWGILCAVILLWGAAAVAFLLQESTSPRGSSRAPRAGQLFDTSTVWPARLRIEPDSWDVMEPKGGMPPFGSMTSHESGSMRSRAGHTVLVSNS